MRKLSVIIPCYNSEQTLKEAFDSCVKNKVALPFGTHFEIVLVDDCSTDNTRDVIRDLIKSVDADDGVEVAAIFHERNMGGGAARNTAVANCTGDVIFCLDSDDILPIETLGRMTKMFIARQAAGDRCDGIGLHHSIKFRGSDVKDVVRTDVFGYAGEVIPFDSLLQKDAVMCPLYSVFLFTREAFDAIGGYPTSYGFDTQAFAWRFLANGQVAYTCPEASYLHRIFFTESYYVREFNSGKANYNWRRVLEEYLFLLSDEAADEIMSLDIASYGTPALIDFLKEENRPWRTDVKSFVQPDSRKAFAEKLNSVVQIDPQKPDNKINQRDIYWLGCYLMDQEADGESYGKALVLFDTLIKNGCTWKAVKIKAELCRMLMAEKPRSEISTEEVKLYGLINAKSPYGLAQRTFVKAKNIFKNFWRKSKTALNNPKYARNTFIQATFRMFKIGFNRHSPSTINPDEKPIDIVIPTVSKDYALVEEVLQSLRLNLRHQINKIYVVSRSTDSMKDFCTKNGCVFIDEIDMIGFGKDKIRYVVYGMDRSGWIYQQLIKLSGEKIVEMEDYFVLDSDTILVRPHSFKQNGKYVFFQSSEWHRPYFKAFRWMFGYPVRSPFSYIAHMMIFNTNRLKELKAEIERKHNKSFYDVFLSTVDENEISCVADYETYAQWMRIRHPEEVVSTPFYNTAFGRDKLLPLPELMEKYSAKYKSVSFHHYKS